MENAIKLVLMVPLFVLQCGSLHAQAIRIVPEKAIELAFYKQRPASSSETLRIERFYGRKNSARFEVTKEGKNKERYYMEVNRWPTIGT